MHRHVEDRLGDAEAAREVSTEMLGGILQGLTDLGRWRGLQAWFLGGAGRSADADGVRRLATEAMRALLVNLRRIATSSQRSRAATVTCGMGVRASRSARTAASWYFTYPAGSVSTWSWRTRPVRWSASPGTHR